MTVELTTLTFSSTTNAKLDHEASSAQANRQAPGIVVRCHTVAKYSLDNIRFALPAEACRQKKDRRRHGENCKKSRPKRDPGDRAAKAPRNEDKRENEGERKGTQQTERLNLGEELDVPSPIATFRPRDIRHAAVVDVAVSTLASTQRLAPDCMHQQCTGQPSGRHGDRARSRVCVQNGLRALHVGFDQIHLGAIPYFKRAHDVRYRLRTVVSVFTVL
ncbi:hypothetical protein FI667_g10674, partial [Globisporangium splendens]